MVLNQHDSLDEIVRRGLALYEREIRANVESENQGRFVVINVATGEFEMDTDDLVASKRAKVRFGDSPLFTVRIGHATAYRIGGPLRATET